MGRSCIQCCFSRRYLRIQFPDNNALTPRLLEGRARRGFFHAGRRIARLTKPGFGRRPPGLGRGPRGAGHARHALRRGLRALPRRCRADRDPRGRLRHAGRPRESARPHHAPRARLRPRALRPEADHGADGRGAPRGREQRAGRGARKPDRDRESLRADAGLRGDHRGALCRRRHGLVAAAAQPRAHRAAQPRVRGGAPCRRERQSQQVPLPGGHEPRAEDAAQRHHRLLRSDPDAEPRTPAAREIPGICRGHPRQRPEPCWR